MRLYFVLCAGFFKGEYLRRQFKYKSDYSQVQSFPRKTNSLYW
jgi:hypothetical protein